MLCKIWFFSFEVFKMFIFVPKLVSRHNKRQIRKVLVHYFHHKCEINSMLEIFLIQTQMILFDTYRNTHWKNYIYILYISCMFLILQELAFVWKYSNKTFLMHTMYCKMLEHWLISDVAFGNEVSSFPPKFFLAGNCVNKCIVTSYDLSL